MAKKFQDLRARMSAEQRQRAHDRTTALLKELPLHALRQARQLTQESLAKTLGSQQALVSKLERRADMYVSSLRSYIAALGGELEIVARFPEGAVRIAQFTDIATPAQRLGDLGGTMPDLTSAPRRRSHGRRR